MPNRENVLWNRFWRLTVIWEWDYYISKKWCKSRTVNCLCDCWNIHNVVLWALKRWDCSSCWCYSNKIKTKHNMSKTTIYKIFIWIKNRCNNINNQAYKDYWWRWIRCERKSFEEFYSDLWCYYVKWLSIDRINVNWNYCKENCRWATQKEQMNNTRKSRIINYNWLSHTMKQWSEILWINYRTLSTRINRDWLPIEVALWK